MRRKNRPEQLHLELVWSYLEQLESTGESMTSYEQSAVYLYRKEIANLPPNPMVEEIVRSS